jgi:hypothetical protein
MQIQVAYLTMHKRHALNISFPIVSSHTFSLTVEQGIMIPSMFMVDKDGMSLIGGLSGLNLTLQFATPFSPDLWGVESRRWVTLS